MPTEAEGGSESDFVFSVFRSELQHQCSRGLVAWRKMNRALNELRPGNSLPIDDFWYHSSAFLNSAANVSRMLWPTASTKQVDDERQRAPPKYRGVRLRTHLGLKGPNPLAARLLRDHFEHFDERMEHWAETSKRRIFVDRSIGNPNHMALGDPGDALRNYDPETRIMHFRGEGFALEPLANALNDILEKVEQLDRVLWGPHSRKTHTVGTSEH